MDDLNHSNEPIDFNFLTSMQIKAGRICSSSWKDTEGVKPRFSGVSTYKAAVGITAAGIVGGSVTTTTPTSSTIKNEQDEKNTTLYAFYYYHITAEDRKCSCYVCADLAAFKPKKQNDASAIGFAVTTKKQSRRRAHI